MSRLSAQHLAKQYKSRLVVKDVSFNITSGEVVGLLKTTSFYMMVGLIPCEQGSIFLGEQDITRLPMHKRALLGLGYLPQEPQRLPSLLEDLRIQHIANNLGMSLSGGERRRVEIARALASEPRFMLLDEPFAGVDPLSVLDIQRIIAQLSRLDIGILITDHNVRETLEICDRAYIVNEGELIASGAPESILHNEQVREVYLGHDFRL